ncbi:MAG: tRNA-dihydrouridine synthase [Campylobacteraceae bacterium]|nr:tRNA-dihydrouridine synthase [Campylobacteraceae bacterium]
MIDFSNKPLYLAPLAGYSDIPLRGVVKRFGCDVTTSEMISANALAFRDKKTFKMLQKNEAETPYIVQIAGNDAEIVKKAVLVLNEFDFIDGIDLNCGCPAKKIVNNGSGSYLLNDIDKLRAILETIKTHSNKTYTSVKIRLGYDKDDSLNIVKALDELELSYIAIHGRTKAGGYRTKADHTPIKNAKEIAKTPIIANGDINEYNASDVLGYTKADALMIGRACIGKPWIFYEIKHSQTITKELKKEIIICHFDEMIKHYSGHGVTIFRKHLHQYSKGMDEAANFRNEINTIKDSEIMRDKIEQFFS